MPSKKNLESAPATPPTAVVTPPPAAPRGRGLTIAGIAVGGVIIAGALFGSGVAVGAHLPGDGLRTDRTGQFDQQRGMPGGDRPLGDRPSQPGQQTNDTDSDGN